MLEYVKGTVMISGVPVLSVGDELVYNSSHPILACMLLLCATSTAECKAESMSSILASSLTESF